MSDGFMNDNGLERLMASPPYAFRQEEKRAILTDRARHLTRHHYEH